MVNTVVKKVYVLDGGELELDASVMVSGLVNSIDRRNISIFS